MHMEETVRSGGSLGVVMKKRNSSGCLIVKKKGDAVGGLGFSSSAAALNSNKEKMRRRLPVSDSESSDELVMAPLRRVGEETLRICNGINAFEKGSREGDKIGRVKNSLEYSSWSDDSRMRGTIKRENHRNGSRLDVFEFNEYDGVEKIGPKIGERRLSGSMHLSRNDNDKAFKAGSSRHMVDKKTNNYRSSHEDGAQVPLSVLRDKFMAPSDEPIRVQGENGVLKVMVNNKRNMDVLEINDHRKCEENEKKPNEDAPRRNFSVTPSVHSEIKYFKRRGSFTSSEKDRINLQIKKGKGDTDISLNHESEFEEARKLAKRASCEVEKTPSEKLPRNAIKEGKVKRGSGTEKQKLRVQIREMLINAGWIIDYRPRRNRDYLDAVYINPSGTAYWSIIKAYDALQKQSSGDDNEIRPCSGTSSFKPIENEVLNQLTRNTQKKIEKEFKKKKKDIKNGEKVKKKDGRKSTNGKYDVESTDSYEERLSSFIKHGSKSLKNRVNENEFSTVNLKGQNSSNIPSFGFNSSMLQGRKRRKLGLLVRGSKKGPNSDDDGFVPYTGKRTLLSWLIDSETVHLSQKVQYMNRRQTRVMLQGWITRDGIHCGCCSKILTVSKFELHAGSKLRQPFQNIVLESGVSLMQCQIDAWNRQEESDHLSFYSIEIDGDDPNDDTCGICGDGGDLICCDGCPSTFHQSCLDIQIPPGDWHCPNCTCKFCGSTSGDDFELDDDTATGLSVCAMCERKYHISCIKDMDSCICLRGLKTSFCGQICQKLFGNLQKFLGIKHDLDGGFSWSLIHRTNDDCDTPIRGLPHRVECNSKLAVALTVMDECFLPVVDRRSGINLIHNVLYNSGSNFNRLNYSGFYTAVLERGDEIISVASIRFHGTKLVEMPYIGTRHIYRRQGMCRRLFCAIEVVEKLIIPAIAELMHTWTVGFGFTPLEESLKEEMRSMNMLVFPGTDMLQKELVGEDATDENIPRISGGKAQVSKGKQFARSRLPRKMNTEFSPGKCTDSDETDLNHLNGVTDEIVSVNSGTENLVVSSLTSNLQDACNKIQTSVLMEGSVNLDSPSEDKFLRSASDMDHISTAMEGNDIPAVGNVDGKSRSLFTDNNIREEDDKPIVGSEISEENGKSSNI